VGKHPILSRFWVIYPSLTYSLLFLIIAEERKEKMRNSSDSIKPSQEDLGRRMPRKKPGNLTALPRRVVVKKRAATTS